MGLLQACMQACGAVRPAIQRNPSSGLCWITGETLDKIRVAVILPGSNGEGLSQDSGRGMRGAGPTRDSIMGVGAEQLHRVPHSEAPHTDFMLHCRPLNILNNSIFERVFCT